METSTITLPKNDSFKGSRYNYEKTKEAVGIKYGSEEAERYNPDLCRTMMGWNRIGFRIKKGEKAIVRCTTYIPVDNAEGEELSTIPKSYVLFYYLQTEKV